MLPSQRRRIAMMAFFGLVGSLMWAAPVQAAQISVNTTDDEYNTDTAECSLREAVKTANSDADFGGCIDDPADVDTISLGSNTYSLNLGPSGDDATVSVD